mmetsp:Transcript_18971/g.44198  ORF Transcript_18971/g.44198 Transcript_18971/m.44198 type:complete len:364 (+) Transcript_18971:81-1172(+)
MLPWWQAYSASLRGAARHAWRTNSARQCSQWWSRYHTRKCAAEAACTPKPVGKAWCNPAYIVHIGNVVALAAVSQSDMLYLRCLLVVSTCCGMAYNLLQATPLWAPAAWGIVFLSMHLRQIVMLLRENEKLVLSAEEEQLYEKAFMTFGFSPRSFKDLLTEVRARWCTWDKNTYVQKMGDPMEELNYLVEGDVMLISCSNDPMHTVSGGKGGWLGELFDPHQKEDYWEQPHNWLISFQCISEQCRTVAFNRRALHEAFKSSTKMEQAATRAQVSDLWGKLHASLPSHRRNAYEGMLQVAVSDGNLDESERRMLEAFRKRHGITNEEHEAFLDKLGWTVEDFHNGRQASAKASRWYRSYSGKIS